MKPPANDDILGSLVIELELIPTQTPSLSRLQEDPPEGVSAAPTENNILLWHAVIFGPEDTPFEDGMLLRMSFSFFARTVSAAHILFFLHMGATDVVQPCGADGSTHVVCT